MAALRNHLQAQDGFTLLELLVVITIIATVSGIVVLSIGTSERQLLTHEAEYLQNNLMLASDAALFQNTLFGVTIAQTEYCFSRFDINTHEWKGISKPPLSYHVLAPTITLSLVVDGKSVVTENSCEQHMGKPSLYFMPDGESSVFSLRMAASGKSTLLLTSDGVNPITISKEDRF